MTTRIRDMKLPIIPIDPRTGKPREGKWVNRHWIPKKPEPITPMPQSNPNFVDRDYRSFY